jgi:hypothetical protein
MPQPAPRAPYPTPLACANPCTRRPRAGLHPPAPRGQAPPAPSIAPGRLAQVQRIRGGWCCESAPGRGLVGALGDVALWDAVLDPAAVAAVLRDGAPARGPGVRLSLKFLAGGGPEPGLWRAVVQDGAPGSRDGSLVGDPRPSVHHPPPTPADRRR